MILTGPEIRQQMELGRIRIDPLPASGHFGPNSVDVHLGHELRVYRRTWWDRVRAWARLEPWAIDPERMPVGRDVATEVVPLVRGRWLLRPGRVYLGATLERTSTDGLVPYLDGRSSLGRLGVFAHVTAGRGDDGFSGHWTVEMVAVESVWIRPGSRLFQLTYHQVRGQRQPYAGQYGGRSGPHHSGLGRGL